METEVNKQEAETVCMQVRLTPDEHKMLKITKAYNGHKTLGQALTKIMAFYRDNHKETPANTTPETNSTPAQVTQ